MVEPAVKITNLSYTYSPETAFAFEALHDINLEILRGTFTAVVGHTGSGKSTLMQLIDGLLTPSKGSVCVNDVEVTANASKSDLARLRHHVGFVFQFPESQLFADSVIEDVKFGPRNLGYDDIQVRKYAEEALGRLHFSEELYDQSPFELSGGQMRRVAIAGVIAMHPDILILDEPTAGLDPSGRLELMELIKQLHHEGITIILITHQMEQVAEYADHVIALNHGQLAFQGVPRDLFKDNNRLHQMGLTAPLTVNFAQRLAEEGIHFGQVPLDIEELVTVINQQKGTVHYGK